MTLALPSKAPGPLIAHRGASAHAPENTIPAYQLAADAGFAWIEVDTQLTRDGYPVMMHDFTVDRTTSGTGHVCKFTLKEIRRLEANKRFPDYGSLQVPTLEESLACVLRNDIGIVLEVKPIWGSDIEHARVVAERIDALWPRDNDKLVISSFSSSCLIELRRLLPWVSLALATDVIPTDPKAYLDMLGISAFHVNYGFALYQGLDRLLTTGAHISVATVNDPQIAATLLARGAHGVMTDRINLLGDGDPVVATA
jgi:glycerophosphoryl diester phosphodiesterase